MPFVVSLFCASSDAIAPEFYEAGKEVGERIAQQEMDLIYGGEDIGLMGCVARAVRTSGGTVTGVITKFIKERETVNLELVHRLLIARDFAHRKQILVNEADAFIALPGGYGTLDELFEIINLRQIGVLTKPLALLNTNGFFFPLAELLSRISSEGFSRTKPQDLFYLAETPAELVDYLVVVRENQAKPIEAANSH